MNTPDLNAIREQALSLMRAVTSYDDTAIDDATLNNLRALVGSTFDRLMINYPLTIEQVNHTIALFRTAYLLGWRDGQAEATTTRLVGGRAT